MVAIGEPVSFITRKGLLLSADQHRHINTKRTMREEGRPEFRERPFLRTPTSEASP
jgi:hypothetical protein